MLGGDTEELDDVSDVGIAVRPQFSLDAFDRVPEFLGGLRVQLFHPVGTLAHHVITRRLAEIDFVEGGAVVKKGTADQTDLLEGGHAAVDRHEVAFFHADVGMETFNTGGLGALAQGGEDGEARLRDPETR